ncbi:hypothetical protein JST97_16435 [bacterium]|nr:hypothetical protein [bacterium]
MIIARNHATPPRRLPGLAGSPLQDPDQAPTPPPGKGDVFLRASSQAARKLSEIGGFTNGASLGYLGGALAGASMGASGPVCWAVALASAGVAGVAGYKVGGQMSDWAARTAVKLSPQHPLAADVAGRTTLNLAVDLLTGSPVTAALDLSVTAGWGAYKAIRAPKAPQP